MKLKNESRTATPISKSTRDAWWYENPGSIDIVVEIISGTTGQARIRRSQLVGWIKRTERK